MPPTTGELIPEQRVLQFIRKQNLVISRQKLLVAVSGGPDSVCLLSILVKLRKELGMELYVAHLNHQLRGSESEADADYVAGLAQSLKIPATIESHDVEAFKAQHHTSLEEAAREVRYNFLVHVAGKVNADRIAAGHTADDNVETILMHLLRGSGTRGLRGLQPLSQWQSSDTNFTIIRPLLELSREETTAYCRQYKLNPRIDSSNLLMDSFRNRIRHHLLPQLRKYNPKVTNALLRTARIATDDLDFIDNESVRLWDKIIRKESDSIVIDKKGISNLPSALKRHLLRASMETLLGNLKDIEAGHIEELINALEKPTGKAIGLPGGLNFTIEYDRYVLGPDSAALSPFPILEAPVKLNIPGNTRIPGWEIKADIVPLSDAKTTGEEAGGFTACFDYEKTGNHLIVRSRQPGDRLQPLGMEQTKKLNEYMIDARIPRSWRHRIPLVISPKYIIWVVGWRIDERAKVNAGTGKVLRIHFIRI